MILRENEPSSVNTSTTSILLQIYPNLNTSKVSQSDVILYNCSNLNTSKDSQLDIDLDDILYELSYQAVALAGIFGNILGIVFLLYTNVKKSFHVFLISLMLNDVVYLLIALTRSILILLVSFQRHLLQYNLRVLFIYLKMTQIFLFNTSAFIITCMSVERFVNVCFPLRGIFIGSRRCAFAAICIGLVLNTLVCIPKFILQDLRKSGDSHTIFSPLKWKNDNGDVTRMYFTVVISVTRYVPATIAFLANAFLLTKLLRRNPRRRFLFANRQIRKDRSRFDDFGTTITLILINTFLLLSLLPTATAQILIHNYPEIYLNVNRKENIYLKSLMAFGIFASAFSAANDFVLYILLSRRSRETLKHIVKRRCNCQRRRRGSQIFKSRSRAMIYRHSADSYKFSMQNIHQVRRTVTL